MQNIKKEKRENMKKWKIKTYKRTNAFPNKASEHSQNVNTNFENNIWKTKNKKNIKTKIKTKFIKTVEKNNIKI